jgi:chromatin remodeling complex protein RSC6
MARTAAPAATKPSAPVPAAAPAKKAEPAPKAAAKEPKAAAAPVAATPAVEPAAPAAEPVAATNPCEELGSKLTSVVAALKELQSLVKALSKDYDKMKKTVEKSERKRANARTNPNGFAKPTKIVDELCDFCGVERGTKMSRTDVTRAINSYIKEKNLNKPENKRQILPDEKLRTLLKLKAGEEVNYFRMQAFLSPLFIKETATA